MIISVFTEKYRNIQRKLITATVVESTNGVVPVKAQWDTGATATCISKKLVEKLNLLPTGKVRVSTPSGTGIMNKYIINLILNNEVRIQNLIVMDSEIGNQGIDVLIGMDIISIGDFAVSNYNGKTQFSFRLPSQEHIEFRR
ncbi:MAG: hypothetical protein HDR06_00265 [Lachnospiraceae bacterium]|nr:hypothetical protein [Lachnospiraceae bacterium]